MVTIVIVGILAAVAIPAYQRYMIKAKLADVIAYADVAKLAFTETFEETGECPTVAGAGLKQTSPIPHISRVSYAWDRNPCEKWFEVYLEIDGQSEPSLEHLDRDRVMIRGNISQTGQVTWQCGFSRYTPAIKRYLPISCQDELL
jgi:type IV pilus assembly protein PilA